MSTTDYGAALQRAANDVRTGPIGEMCAAGRLTPADLRAGATRAEGDARCRRVLADRMEAGGLTDVSVSEAAAWMNLIAREAADA